MNLGLLDEMVVPDAGTTEGEGDVDGDADGDSDADSDTDSDADGDGPTRPDTDPSDETPPVLLDGICGLFETKEDSICVAVGPASASFRFTTDEPALVTVTSSGSGKTGVVSATWETEHHLGAALLEAGAHEITISYEDVNGNSDGAVISVTPTGGPPVAITEVLADPLGAEPSQEFVEIANFGDVEVDISDWMIDDNGDQDGDLIPAGTSLEPGAVAVLVANDFDTSSTDDPGVSAGAAIIYLDSSIGSSGLKNSDAEPVQLWDASGTLVSEYLAQVGNPKEGKSAKRLYAELPDDDELAFGTAPEAPSTPGEAEMF